ncbi:uracil-DNA glycosylase [Clostridiaceae bacterium DONG20-135]|uniref:Uracil-DNA glycosylase n=1 Tax=Copranaerobaculum intestinale TaxID=2692629 RepID=A0A6N8U226_9FIRM|nr:uracil-DNA glycosylase [Copranaerobaculum intestinale]MXQ72376.1 uracil-DNA glycosylase [Copranaerobaculum intestinale]
MNWSTFFEEEKRQDYFQKLIMHLDEAYASARVYPPREKLFSCFEACPLDQVKVVIIGQDPYHQPGQAHGLCFSVSPDTKLPPSLRNIYKERETDLQIPVSKQGYLQHWADQGVLMMNAVMSVEEGKPGSHRKFGWEIFTDHVIDMLNRQDQTIVYILWGNYAISKKCKITNPMQYCLCSAHPSPLSAYHGFFGSRPFSRTNAILVEHGLAAIDWSNE